jgi:hypothetical protein
MVRRRRDGNHSPKKNNNNNSIEYTVGNKRNGYPVPDLNKTMINVTEKPSDIHKKRPSKKKSWEKFPRNTWKRHWKWLTRMYKRHSRNFEKPNIMNMILHRKK